MSFTKFSGPTQTRLLKLGAVLERTPDVVIRPMSKKIYALVTPVIDALEGRKREEKTGAENRQQQFAPMLERLCRAIGPVEGRTWAIVVQDAPELTCTLTLKKDGHSWRWSQGVSPDLVIEKAQVLESILCGKINSEWLGKEVKSSDMMGLMDLMVHIDTSVLDQPC